jgi:pullulanase
MVCNGEIINPTGIENINNQSVTIPPRSAVILYQE